MLKRGSCAKEVVGSTFALRQKNEANNVETGVSRIHIKKDTHLTQGQSGCTGFDKPLSTSVFYNSIKGRMN
jgi:hypothetical protein